MSYISCEINHYWMVSVCVSLAACTVGLTFFDTSKTVYSTQIMYKDAVNTFHRQMNQLLNARHSHLWAKTRVISEIQSIL